MLPRDNTRVKYEAFRSVCDDIGVLMVTMFLVPIAILILGVPIALCVRAAVAILTAASHGIR